MKPIHRLQASCRLGLNPSLCPVCGGQFQLLCLMTLRDTVAKRIFLFEL